MNPFGQMRANRKRIVEGSAWVIAMILLSVLIVYLLRGLESYLKASEATLQSFAFLVYIGVFVIAVLNSATIIIPAPGIAIIIALATQWNPVIVALLSGIGASIGEMSGYLAGRVGERIIVADQMYGYNLAKTWLQRHGYWVVSIFAFIPLVMFDIVGLVGGGLKIPWWRFLIATLVGRIPRAFVEIFAGATLLRLIFPQWFV